MISERQYYDLKNGITNLSEAVTRLNQKLDLVEQNMRALASRCDRLYQMVRAQDKDAQ